MSYPPEAEGRPEAESVGSPLMNGGEGATGHVQPDEEEMDMIRFVPLPQSVHRPEI